MIATDYETLMIALVRRKQELGLSNLDVDELGGLQTGYFGKLACGTKRVGIVSLGRVLAALDVAIVLTPTNHILGAGKEAMNAKGKGAKSAKAKNGVLAKRGAKGGRMKWSMMTNGKRRRHIAKMVAAAQKARIRRLAELS